jgi:hypothetical protein
MAVTVEANGDVVIRANDPNYARPGPDEKQRFDREKSGGP